MVVVVWCLAMLETTCKSNYGNQVGGSEISRWVGPGFRSRRVPDPLEFTAALTLVLHETFANTSTESL